MPIQRPILSLLSMLGLLCFLQFAACGNQGVGRSVHGGAQGTPVAAVPSALSQSTIDHAVPPVVLHDPAPGELEVVFNVNMPGYGADRGNTMIGLSFLSHGNAVQLVGHEQLMCNGKAMPVHQQYALFQLVDAPSRTLEAENSLGLWPWGLVRKRCQTISIRQVLCRLHLIPARFRLGRVLSRSPRRLLRVWL